VVQAGQQSHLLAQRVLQAWFGYSTAAAAARSLTQARTEKQSRHKQHCKLA
jgi:hypothetical protein